MPVLNRTIIDRIQDRLWREIALRSSRDAPVGAATGNSQENGSISAGMPWTRVCAALAEGTLDGRDFRRLRAVRNVVETVGPTEARHYLRRTREWGAEWLESPQVAAIDDWGNPVRLPRILLSTTRAFSPTTLRYLATALWLKRSGKLPHGTTLLEIGVGFGGLAAMNAMISEATTILADLPQVEQAAMSVLSDLGLESYAMTSSNGIPEPLPLVVSNYAFTELNRELQDQYLERYLKHARHGVIVSNANVFASRIGGRTDEELVEWLGKAGIPARADQDHELLTPIDTLCKVSLIHW